MILTILTPVGTARPRSVCVFRSSRRGERSRFETPPLPIFILGTCLADLYKFLHCKFDAAYASTFGEEALPVAPLDSLAVYFYDTCLPDSVKCDLLLKVDGHLFSFTTIGTHIKVELEAVPIASPPRLGVLLIDRHARPV